MMRPFRCLVAAFALLALALPAHSAPIKQLGFALDSSGSISEANYEKVRNGLKDALAALPQDGSVEITVVRFANSAQVLVPPTVLNSAAALAAIEAGIDSQTNTGGLTDTRKGINKLTHLMVNSTNFDMNSDTQSFINITTDGQPTKPGNRNNAQNQAIQASQNAHAAGIDSLSVEVIDGGANAANLQNKALQLVFPGPAQILAANSTNIPDPLQGSWVVPVTDFDTYAGVINAKVQGIVNVPEPGMLALAGIGVIGMVVTRRRRTRAA